MGRTAWPTFSSGDTMTAAQFNSLWRDNDIAYWPYQARGDLAARGVYVTLIRRSIGAAGKVLTSNGSALTWATLAFAGMNKNVSAVTFTPDQDFGNFADISGATKTISLPVTCSVLVIASVTGYATAGSSLKVCAVVNGVADANPAIMENASSSPARQELLFYAYLTTGVTAGSRVVKLQGSGGHVSWGYMLALAIGE